MADESSLAARVFPPRAPSPPGLPPRDALLELLRPGMVASGNPAAAVTGDPRTEGFPTGQASLYDRLGMLAQYFGNALPFRGALRAPLLETKAKYLHPKTGEEPTRVYHGTKHAFGELDVTKSDPQALYGPGIYFTENPKVATGYAGHPLQVNYDEWVKAGLEAQTPRLNIRPAHLNIQNPLEIETRYKANDILARMKPGPLPWGGDRTAWKAVLKEDIIEPAVDKQGRVDGATLYQGLVNFFGGNKERAREALIDLGFDGITHMGGAITGTPAHRVWIAFQPEQVVSPFENAAKHAVTR